MVDIPEIQLDFIFRLCRDITIIHDFYTKIIGLTPKTYSAEHGWLQFDFLGVSLVFTTGDQVQKHTNFAIQPGHDRGEIEVTSFAIKFSEVEFEKLWEKIENSSCQIQPEKPEWRMDSYWGFTIMDPMGVSLELYSTPKKKPDNTEWN